MVTPDMKLLKPLLPKGKYYQAIGTIVDTALSRILKDILAISDITEVESHKLSELCRIMNSLEGLFVENPDHVSSQRITSFSAVDLTYHVAAIFRSRLCAFVAEVFLFIGAAG